MKKLATFLVLCLTCAFCALSFTACDLGIGGQTSESVSTDEKKEDNETVEEKTDNIYGTYYFYNLMYNGKQYNIGDTYDGDLLTKDYATITLNEDESGELRVQAGKAPFTYKKASEKYFLTFGNGQMMEMTIIDGLLTLYWDDSVNEVRFKNKSDNGTVEEKTDNIYGTYYFYSYTVNGEQYNLGDTYKGDLLTKDSYIIKINADNSVILNSEEGTASGVLKLQSENECSVITFGNYEMYDARIEYGFLSIYYGGRGDKFKMALKRDKVIEPESEIDYGTFYFYSYRMKGTTYYIGDVFYEKTLTKDYATIDIHEDGSAELYTSGVKKPLTYEKEGKKYVLTSGNDKIEMRIIDGILSIYSDSNDVMKFKK